MREKSCAGSDDAAAKRMGTGQQEKSLKPAPLDDTLQVRFERGNSLLVGVAVKDRETTTSGGSRDIHLV